MESLLRRRLVGAYRQLAPEARLRELVAAVRDEAHHRDVNHRLAAIERSR
jgi:hypothetical protein